MKNLLLSFAATLVLNACSTQTVGRSAYVGEETRGIKALAPAEVDGLLGGKGLGFARSAELNGYPGPAHVLELSDELALSAEQISETR
ncbi:MAG: hypothetical protein KJZ83_03505, partial [Burkholderiaceae bacterium]|nr:hypothetical protein [Burkholderiaceae bacterium]